MDTVSINDIIKTDDQKEDFSYLTLHKKLLRARLMLAGVVQSGKNDYSNYSYFELSDFMPKINKINDELGIFTAISFDKEYAKLTIINVDNQEDTIVITSPMAGAKLPGCHEIQNLGAVESYQRRYLYMTAYEITEPDKLEQNGVVSEQNAAPNKPKKTAKQTRDELVAEWGKSRSKLQELNKDVRNPKTNNYVCTKAEIPSQDVNDLDNKSLKCLIDVYHEMIAALGGK